MNFWPYNPDTPNDQGIPMNRSVLSVFLLIACSGVAASEKMAPDSMAVIGQWQGRGDTVGQEFTTCARFAPYMNNLYLHLDYRVHYDQNNGVPDAYNESFYYFLEDGQVEGLSLDNFSNMFQITGRFADQRMSTQWLKNGKIAGKAEWVLSKDNQTLTIVRFGLLESGELKEIGTVVMSRLQNGEVCKM
jgi:hypothetical protein